MSNDFLEIAGPKYSLKNKKFREDVLMRLESWLTASKPFIEEYYTNPGGKHKLKVLDRWLFMAVKSYFDDIYKFKEYTGSTTVSKFKKASFTLKWISKYKPIQICVNDESELKIEVQALDINNLFALKCACWFLGPETFDQLMKKRPDLVEIIFYNLTFRDPSGKGYSLVFKLIDESLSPSNN